MSVQAVGGAYDFSFLPAPLVRPTQAIVPLVGPAAGLYYAIYGLAETVKELWCLCGPTPRQQESDAAPSLWQRFVVWMHNVDCPHVFHAVHGVLFVGSGLSQLFCGLHDMSLLSLGGAATGLLYGGGALLVGAHLYGIYHFANLFWQAYQAEGAAADDDARAAAQRQKVAALLSLAGTVAYFVSAVIALFEPLAAAVIVFAALGMLTTAIHCLWLGVQWLRAA